MFDLSLVRVPTFVGGLTSAFGISASLFALLTYLVLYIQNLLGYSAIEAGVRFLPLTGAIFLTAGIAGRLSARVPTRLLIGPGFVLIGDRPAAHARPDARVATGPRCSPGMIVAGVGAGLVNVPLAIDRRGGRRARAGRHGVGRERDVPAGRDRDRHRRARRDLLPQRRRPRDAAGVRERPQRHPRSWAPCVAFVSAVAAFTLIRQRDYVEAASSSSTTTSGGASSRSGRPLVPSPEVT